MAIRLFLGIFPYFAVDFLENVKKLNSKFASEDGTLIRNRDQSFCKQKMYTCDFKSITTLSFHKMLTGK